MKTRRQVANSIAHPKRSSPPLESIDKNRFVKTGDSDIKSENEFLIKILAESFADERLDHAEKIQFQDIFATLSEEQRAFVRNRALDLVTEYAGDSNLTRVLTWLKNVLKTLDSSRPSQPSINSCFSPGNTCRSAIISAIDQAVTSIDVCVFTISDNLISQALQRAYSRSVNVRILTDNDKQFDLGSDIAELSRCGIDVRTDRSPHHMHHKFAIIDNKQLITGSFNWTRSASEYNHENIILMEEEISVHGFIKEFQKLWDEFGESLGRVN